MGGEETQREIVCPDHPTLGVRVIAFRDDYGDFNWLQVICFECEKTLYYNGA